MIKKILFAFAIFVNIICCKPTQSKHQLFYKENKLLDKDTILSKVQIPDLYYDIEITHYKNNLIKYAKSYQNYWNVTYEYFIVKDSISTLNVYGKEATVRSKRAGDENKNLITSYLYEKKYDFREKPFKILEKRLAVYKNDDFKLKVKEFNELISNERNIDNHEFLNIYKTYVNQIKK